MCKPTLGAREPDRLARWAECGSWLLGVQVSDQKLEKLFGQFDKDESGMIDYTEFKQCWLMYAPCLSHLAK